MKTLDDRIKQILKLGKENPEIEDRPFYEFEEIYYQRLYNDIKR